MTAGRHVPSTPVERRRAAGRAARERVARNSLGRWTPGQRQADALEVILGQSGTRLGELTPIRHARMTTSPWLPGPFEWDVKRLVTSLVIVARGVVPAGPAW